MQIFVRTDKPELYTDEAIVFAFTEEQAEEIKKSHPSESVASITYHLLTLGDFKANNGQLVVLPKQEVVHAHRLMLLGLGKEKELDTEKIRRAYSVIAKKIRELKISSFALAYPATTLSDYDATISIVEGIVLGTYKFSKYVTEDK